MSANWPWVELGLDAPAETERAVRRAYASRLRAIDLETDIAGFEALRMAYQVALKRVTSSGDGSGNVPANYTAEDIGPSPAPRVDRESPVRANVGEANSDELNGPVPAEFTESFALIAEHLQAKNYAVATWQHLLSKPDISAPETKIAVERLLVRALEAKSRDEAYPPLEWLRIMDARYGWVTDGVGFVRRHPGGGAVLNELVELLGVQGKNAFQLHGRPVPIFLRWYAILAYTFVIIVAHSFVFV